MKKPRKSRAMSKTMQLEEAAACAAALRGKPEPVEPAYQEFIETVQGQKRLPFGKPEGEGI
jgi:hypothetical protein